MTVLSQLVAGEGKRVAETAEPIGVGDALIVGDEVLLVLHESGREAVRAQARFECGRALQLRDEARELLAWSRELQLKFTEAREVRRRS